jgi:hypothetical protein
MKKIISLAVGSAMLLCGSLAYSDASEFSGNLSSAQTLAAVVVVKPKHNPPPPPPKPLPKPKPIPKPIPKA